ncbi:transcriptional regulator [Agromyces sp. CF514]|uniref:MarR family winged helix-turn-helix transcriptional regulator n=1 Tax=Agromyces sp. CF514 TaxID=1881031 RepID=UPI0008EF4052|nr:MarR family winged helix-turn-helix transcriptional regulator [Agromyces sp. CF514]SFR67664.1 transcriptional regulator [Agromyces sp. CF514]
MSTDPDRLVAEWLRWKRANELVRAAIVDDVVSTSDVPEAELTVLVQLHQADGVMRQNALAAAAGWDRTRLSHLLTRMEGRGYVSRTKLRNGVEVTLHPAGATALDSARPQLERAVQTHLFGRLDPKQREAFGEILDALLE